MENLKEFKELIKRYESITLEDIDKAVILQCLDIASFLTGFGTVNCRLCKAVKHDCLKCVYSKFFSCVEHITYDRIHKFSHLRDGGNLLNAFKERALFMRNKLIKLNINFEEI